MTASARITTIQIYDSRNQHSYDGDDDGADNGAVNAANAAVNVAEGRELVRMQVRMQVASYMYEKLQKQAVKRKLNICRNNV